MQKIRAAPDSTVEDCEPTFWTDLRFLAPLAENRRTPTNTIH